MRNPSPISAYILKNEYFIIYVFIYLIIFFNFKYQQVLISETRIVKLKYKKYNSYFTIKEKLRAG